MPLIGNFRGYVYCAGDVRVTETDTEVVEPQPAPYLPLPPPASLPSYSPLLPPPPPPPTPLTRPAYLITLTLSIGGLNLQGSNVGLWLVEILATVFEVAQSAVTITMGPTENRYLEAEVMIEKNNQTEARFSHFDKTEAQEMFDDSNYGGTKSSLPPFTLSLLLHGDGRETASCIASTHDFLSPVLCVRRSFGHASLLPGISLFVVLPRGLSLLP